MRIAALAQPGAPERFTIEELDNPKAGPYDTVVRVLSSGVCGHDLLARAGGIPRRFPVILGHEIAGVVQQVGGEVNGLCPGDRVVVTGRGACGECAACRADQENRCQEPRDYGDSVAGGYAEQCRVHASDVVLVPEAVSDDAAAVASCAIATALHAIERLEVFRGQQVLVTGAGGGVGVHALQILRMRGAIAIAVTSSQAKAAALAAFADEVVVAEPSSIRARLRRQGLRPDRALELTAGLTLPEVIASLSSGGRVCIAGNVRSEPICLGPGRLIVHELEVVGSVGSRKRDLAEALMLLGQGAIEPVIGAVLPLERVSDAHRAMEAHSVVGRIILKPKSGPHPQQAFPPGEPPDTAANQAQ